MIDNLISTAKKLYGTRKDEQGNCAFCGKFLYAYCDCIKSQKANKALIKIRNKASMLERAELFGFALNFKQFSKVPYKYSATTFEDFRTDNKNQQKNKMAIMSYAADKANNFLAGNNMILKGNFGTGKSMLMCALCNEVNEAGYSAKYINITDFVREVKNTFSDGTTKTEFDIIEEYSNTDFLFIDDIDKQAPTEFVKNLMYSVVNKRYESMLPIIVSTNVDVEELDAKFFGEATISRIAERATVLDFTSENERIA